MVVKVEPAGNLSEPLCRCWTVAHLFISTAAKEKPTKYVYSSLIRSSIRQAWTSSLRSNRYYKVHTVTLALLRLTLAIRITLLSVKCLECHNSWDSSSFFLSYFSSFNFKFFLLLVRFKFSIFFSFLKAACGILNNHLSLFFFFFSVHTHLLIRCSVNIDFPDTGW